MAETIIYSFYEGTLPHDAYYKSKSARDKAMAEKEDRYKKEYPNMRISFTPIISFLRDE